MSDDQDSAPEKAPMTVKSMPVAARLRATTRAQANGETMAEWLTRAINQLAEREASGPREIPPAVRTFATERLPEAEPVPVPVMIDARQLAELMQATAAISQAAGVPVPRGTAKAAYALLAQQVRVARGLPPTRKRQTTQLIGQTVDED